MSTAHRIIKQMKHKGNTVLGVGCYSAAIAMKDNTKVVKVGSDIADPCLDFYSKVVEKHKNNPHVPELCSLYVDNDNEFYIAVLGRLEEASLAEEPVCTLCRELCQGYITSDDFITYSEKYSSYMPNPSKMLAVLQTIKSLTEHLGVTLDMHRGNFMLDDGILVITDPWSDETIYDESDLSVWADENIY